MASDFQPDDLQSLWKDQQLDHTRIATEAIRMMAENFQSRIQRRNRREYVAAALAMAGHAVIAAVGPNPWVRAGAILVIAGLIYVCYQLHRRAASAGLPEEIALHPGIGFHRSQLARQRDALRGVWSWYLLPMLPGMLIVLVAGARGVRHAAVNLTGLAAISAGVVWLNHRAANRIQREIDRLDSMEKGESQ